MDQFPILPHCSIDPLEESRTTAPPTGRGWCHPDDDIKTKGLGDPSDPFWCQCLVARSMVCIFCSVLLELFPLICTVVEVANRGVIVWTK